MKTASQIANIFSPDQANIDGCPELLALCEQFYKEHGLPNAAEKALLSRVGNQPYIDIHRWCKSKHSAYMWYLLTHHTSSHKEEISTDGSSGPRGTSAVIDASTLGPPNRY